MTPVTRVAVIAIFIFGVVAHQASSSDTASAPQSKPVCGVVEHVVGQGQLLDSLRTEIYSGVASSPVPCGTWASVGPTEGSVRISLTNGDKVQLSKGTFAQINDENDGLVLLRGNVLVESVEREGETRVLTPNSRARVSYGKSIVIYDPDRDETQLVVLEDRATLENRFESSKKIVARAGEATSLNFKVLRTQPSNPKAVASASLKEKFLLLPVDEAIKKESFAIAAARQKRTFPADLTGEGSALDQEEKSASKRTIASEDSSKKSSYERHPASADSSKLMKRFEQKAAGVDSGTESLLRPTERKKVLDGLKQIRPVE